MRTLKEEYLQNLAMAHSVLQGFKQDMVNKFFRDKNYRLTSRAYDYPRYCYTPTYRERFETIRRMIEISEMLGIKKLDKKKDKLVKNITLLQDPKSIEQREDLENLASEITMIFSGASNEIGDKISLLSSNELDRLNEAIHCLFEGCYYSAIAMSVSAIEFRLLSLMTRANPEAKLEELTLGQLIREYLDKKKEYGHVIPKKHEPLLNHCNVYRIFSVHPKKEEISKPVASSILNMTFMFLLDRNLAEKVRISKGEEQ